MVAMSDHVLAVHAEVERRVADLEAHLEAGRNLLARKAEAS
jgi:hypothetical protein